jgi:hypothetical protein
MSTGHQILNDAETPDYFSIDKLIDQRVQYWQSGSLAVWQSTSVRRRLLKHRAWTDRAVIVLVCKSRARAGHDDHVVGIADA